MGIGRGHGKLILFGEHAAVYGHPAVGMQLPVRLEIAVDETGRWALPDLPEGAAALITAALDRLPQVLREFGIEQAVPGTIEFGGDLPMSVGLGSSAAFCVALLGAVAPSLNGENLWAASHALESAFHGTPSGIDTGLVLHAGCSLLFPDPPALPRREPVSMPLGWIVAGAVPRIRSTGELVTAIRKRRGTDPDAIDSALADLGAIARKAASLGSDGSVSELGTIADRAHTTLESLGLSTRAVSDGLSLLEAHGSLGGKMSGGGGGGVFFGVFAGEAEASRARQELGRWLAMNHPLPTGPFSVAVRL